MGVTITINNYFSQIKGDPRIIKMLDKELTFRHPQAFYMKRRMGHQWDGMVRPLTPAGRVRTGLLPRVVDILSNFTDEVDVIDHRKNLEAMDVPEKIGLITLRDYQKEAIGNILSSEVLGEPFRIGLIAASVNAGKTAMFFGTHMSLKGAKSLLIVDNLLLYEQMVKDSKLVFGDGAGYLQGKNVKWGKFTVAMVKTLNNRLKDFAKELSEFNCLFVDEADLGASATHQNIYKSLTNCSVRVGFTGTVFLRNLAKDRLKNNIMHEQFGEVLFEINMKDLEDLGVSAKTIVRIFPGDSTRKTGLSFKEEFDEVITFNKKRWARIARRVKIHLKMGRDRIIIFNKFKNQTEILHKYLHRKFPKVPMGFTHSDDKDMVKKFMTGEIKVLVASLYMKRGLNIPEIRVVINNAGGEGYANPLQIMGRGTRKHESKSEVFFEDFFDTGKYLTSHSKRRRSYYKGRNLTIEDYTT